MFLKMLLRSPSVQPSQHLPEFDGVSLACHRVCTHLYYGFQQILWLSV